MRSSIKYNLCIFLIIFGIVYILGFLNTAIEGFNNPFGNMFGKINNNPFEAMIKQLQAAQESTSAYDKWIGYVYKHAPENSRILDDFKARVFQPNCKFRKLWATKLPKGMNIPTPAKDSTTANIAYKTFMKCLSSGNSTCLGQLENARVRFMEPGCQFLSPKDAGSYSRNYTVGIK